MNNKVGGRFSGPSKQAGVALVELAAVLAIIALLVAILAPFWSHGTALTASVVKAKIDIGERTQVVVVAIEKPRWSYVTRAVSNGTVTLKFDNGIGVLPGAQLQAAVSTNHRGEAFFTVVGASTGEWTGTATIKVGTNSWGDEAEVKIEVTGNSFEGEYQDNSSLELEDE